MVLCGYKSLQLIETYLKKFNLHAKIFRKVQLAEFKKNCTCIQELFFHNVTLGLEFSPQRKEKKKIKC
jgi:uncharacterized protein YpmS